MPFFPPLFPSVSGTPQKMSHRTKFTENVSRVDRFVVSQSMVDVPKLMHALGKDQDQCLPFIFISSRTMALQKVLIIPPRP